MTLEEIKERRAEMVPHEIDSDLMEMFCWLIGEVESLSADYTEACKDASSASIACPTCGTDVWVCPNWRCKHDVTIERSE